MKLLCMIFVTLYLYSVEALKCYSCTVNDGDMDQRCVTNPGAVETGQTIINCNKNYCTSKRQEYMDPQGKIASFYRGCEDSPQFMNTIQEDGTFRIYYMACQTSLCNGGDGKGDSSSDGFNSDTGAEGNLLVPGTGGGVAITFNVALLVIALYLLLHRN